MAQSFPGKSAPTCQSTPKPGHRLVLPTGMDPTKGQDVMNHSIPGEDTLTFVTLDDSHGKHSVDSGVILDISSIGERDEAPTSEMPAEESAEAGCSYPLSSKIDEIGKRAQDLIERINQSRAMDQEIMASFENELLSKVNEVCQQVKEQMFSSYEEHGRGMEASLQELSEVLERSSQLSMELQGVSQTLSAINTGLLQTPGP
ncbi:synaptonemal complex central element protein 2 [Centroberyx affinis]|uniref:synaptonemal complex central element protein 2 n=1 Tax=Centroberyx affinis TaxID=166261 RepID=UPI003A5C3F27